MKRLWVLWMMLAMLLTACEAVGQAGAFQPAVAQAPVVTGTRAAPRSLPAAVAATPDAAGATATVLSVKGTQAEGTAQAAARTAEAFRVMQTAIAGQQTQAAQMQTQSAGATATERAWVVQGWTATAVANGATSTAAAQATREARQATVTAVFQMTANSAQVTQTQRAYNLAAAVLGQEATATAETLHTENERRRLDLERQRLMNVAWAVTPWALLVLASGAALFVILSFVRAKQAAWSAVDPAPNGDKRVVMVGGKLIDLDRTPFPVLDPNDPQLASTEDHMRLAQGDQRVDAMRSLPRVMQTPFPGGSVTPAFQLLAENDAPPRHLLADPDVGQVLDADWSEV